MLFLSCYAGRVVLGGCAVCLPRWPFALPLILGQQAGAVSEDHRGAVQHACLPEPYRQGPTLQVRDAEPLRQSL